MWIIFGILNLKKFDTLLRLFMNSRMTLSTTHLGISRNFCIGWKIYDSLVAREQVEKCDSMWHLRQCGCGSRVVWMSQLSHRTPPAPGSPLAAFPHHCRLPQALSQSQRCGFPWSSPSLELVGPSTWRSLPVEEETTVRTWTTAGGEKSVMALFWWGEMCRKVKTT